MAAHGYFGTSAITSLTVQSTVGVLSTHPVDPQVLAEALDCLLRDMPPAGIKIGMLENAANVRVVCTMLAVLRREGPRIPVVLDPVLRSSSGRALLDAPGVRMLREKLLPLVDWATPNFSELGVLLGTQVANAEDVEAAAAELCRGMSGVNLVCTGGDSYAANDLVLLASGGREWLQGEKILSSSTHGSGCAFASALLCRLCDGATGVEAARLAKEYVAEAIRLGEPRGAGKGPLNLFWPCRRNQ